MATPTSLTVLGARGSVPVSGDEFRRIGGKTTSFLVTGGDTTLFVDGGTGIIGGPPVSGRIDILLSHFHHDHLLGLPFFPPLYEQGNEVTFYGMATPAGSVEDAVGSFFGPPFFPIALDELPAAATFVDLTEGEFTIGDLQITTAQLSHPFGVTGYRISDGTASIVIATDHEAGDDRGDAALAALALGADILVHDAQYTPDDYEEHGGWGHSTWEHAVAAAETAAVGRLVLTSHDPGRTDDEVDEIVDRARDRFESTVAAIEGLVVAC